MQKFGEVSTLLFHSMVNREHLSRARRIACIRAACWSSSGWVTDGESGPWLTPV